jgi:predicted transcriptional regulator
VHTLKQVAAAIDRTTGRVRQLVRDGVVRAEKIEMPEAPAGYVYRVSDRELKRLVRLFGCCRRQSAQVFREPS